MFIYDDVGLRVSPQYFSSTCGTSVNKGGTRDTMQNSRGMHMTRDGMLRYYNAMLPDDESNMTLPD